MIIDFNKINSGQPFDPTLYYTKTEIDAEVARLETEIENIDLSDYYTSAQTNTQIQNAVADFVTSGDVETQITSKGYAVESAVTAAITSIENELSEAERVTSESLNELDERIDNIDIPDVSNFVTSAQVATQIDEAIADIDLTDYYTKTETDAKVKAVDDRLSVKDEVISTALNELHDEIENIDIPDVSNFVTSGQVQTQIDEAIADIDLTDYYTKTETDTKIKAVEDELSEAEQVTSNALLDLNTHIDEVETVTSNAYNTLNTTKVSSTDIRTIVKLTQAEYDALTTKDNNTLYIIG